MATSTHQIQTLPKSTFSPVARGVVQRRCACGTHTPGGGACGACERKKGTLQRREANRAQGAADAPAAAIVGEAGPPTDLSGVAAYSSTHTASGRPLEPSVAAQYRSRLGPLIDAVRIHDDAGAAAMTRQEGAVAFTSGANIYFSASAYRPHSPAGRNLLSHELAHVWQQHRADGPPAGYQSRPGDRYEQEADRMAASEAFTPPGSIRVPTGARQRRTAMEQIATELRNAVDGWGTDEQAIFNALAGRTPAQIAAIEAAYAALSGGETLESRLRDELSGDELGRALSLLRGESAATEAARQIWDAVEGIGTDESSIYSAVAGRTAEQWQAIQDAYRQMANEGLIPRLQDELSSSEWAHLQTMLPGAAGGAVTADDRATVAANEIQRAVDGFGTDEDAIYSALTGRTPAELGEIAQRYRLLTGEVMETRLRDELSDSDYERVQLLLHPEAPPDRIARELRSAMHRPGTDESAIMAILTGRSPAELPAIRAAYQRLYGESLETRLRDELGGPDLAQAMQLLGFGLLKPADEIHVAVSGPGTDEERLFAVLTEISTSRATIESTIDDYAAKKHGDMLADIRDDLSGRDLTRAMELLHGVASTKDCTPSQRGVALAAISVAISHAQNAVTRLDSDITAGVLSDSVKDALMANFNPAGSLGDVTLARAAHVSGVLATVRHNMLTAGDLTCTSPSPLPCGTTDSCNNAATVAWTCSQPGSLVRLCPAFFVSDTRVTHLLHEFIHHVLIGEPDKAYQEDTEGKGTGVKYSELRLLNDSSARDSLTNADSYAELAEDLSR